MQITVKEQKGLSHSFSVVVPATDIEAQREQELLALGQKVKIQGFRPGKVPLPVLKQRYGKEVLGEVLDASINNATRKLIDEKKLRPALQPDIKITSFEDGSDLAFDVTVEVFPEMPAMDFSKITVDAYQYEIPEAELNESLARLAKSRAQTQKVDRAAKLGDVVKIDFIGKRDGVPFDGGTGNGFQLELGSGQFIPGFEEQLVGLAAGGEKTIAVNFPEEYHSAALAGQPATFDVTVHEVNEPTLPEIDDKLAESLGFKDVENLKGALRQQIDFEYKARARSKAKKQLFDALDATVKIDVPPRMLAFEVESIMKQVLEAKKAGDPDLKDKSEDELNTEYSAIAERRVRLGLLLSETARTNNLQVTREELSAAVMSQARNYPGQEDKVFEFYRKNPSEVQELRGPILEEKAVDFILEKVTRAPKTVTIDELMKDDEDEAAPAKKAKK